MTGKSHKNKGEIVAALLAAAIGVSPVSAPAAQPTLDFQKIITGLPMTPEYPVRMAQGPDGSVYISGNDWSDETNTYSGLLIKLDSAGNLLWYKNISPFGEVDWANGLAVDAFGNAYVPVTDFTNSRTFIVKYGADGNMLKSALMANAGAEYAPVAGGVAFDRSRGRLYASQSYFDQAGEQLMARVEVYNSDLEPQDARTIELGVYGDYNLNVSLGMNSEVYFGGVYGDGAGERLYKAVKYAPGLVDDVWAENAPIGAYDGRFFYPMSQAAPNGGMAFWSISQNGSALRRVSVDGVFASAVDVSRGDYDTLALDSQGGAYLQSWTPDHSRTGLVKVSTAGEYAWGSSILAEPPDSYMLQAMIGEGDKIYTFGEFSTETEYALYLARYTQGGGDVTAPAETANLAVTGVSTNSVTLSWTAPGDDGIAGTAVSYDLRYTTNGAIASDTDFIAATQAPGAPVPQPTGTVETFALPGLTPGTTYFFGLRTADEAGNISGLSNSPAGITSAAATARYSIKKSTGDWQIVTVSGYAAPLVSLVNVSGTTNPAANVGVTFTISGFPAGAAGYELDKSSEASNPDGLADVTLKLGNIPAEYGVTATCPGCEASASSATFTCCGKLKNDDFKQYDVRWATHPYNTQTSLYTKNIRQKGCAVTSLATILNYYAGAFTELGISTTSPKELNDTLVYKFKEKGYGFDNQHRLKFEVVSSTMVSNGKLVSNGRSDYSLPLAPSDVNNLRSLIDSDLDQKLPAVITINRSVLVLNQTTGVHEVKTWVHFMVVVGRCASKYIVSDPSSGTRSLLNPEESIVFDVQTGNTMGPVVGVRRFKKK